MRVAVDTAPLVLTQAGTARWLGGLLAELESRPEVDVERLTWGGPGRLAAAARDTLWYHALLPREARRRGVDLLHCPTYRAPLRSRVPVVVTVHDLAVLRFPETFRRWTRLYGRTLLRPVLHAARRVVAVSEFTRRELVELAGVPAERVDVVPNAVDPAFAALGPAVEGEYALAVGTLEPRKNLPRAIEAARLAGVELRVVGAAGWGSVDTRGARLLGRVADDELAALYRGARCLVYPSLYEGFGIPVAEALACGCPVVTSRGTATEEVAGEAAVLVDPLDVRAIAAGISEADRRRDELRPLGFARAALYTRARAADALLDTYRKGLA